MSLSEDIEMEKMTNYIKDWMNDASKEQRHNWKQFFWLRQPWHKVQPDGDSFVVVDSSHPSDIIACTRSFRKWVYLNGKPVPLSYHFLLRVDNRYQGSGIGEMLERLTFINDYENGTRYIFAYVVQDNIKSLTMQKKFTVDAPEALAELKRIFVLGFYVENLIKHLEKFQKLEKKVEFKRLPTVASEVAFAGSSFKDMQLLPTDLDDLFANPLSEGTFVANPPSQPPCASFSVWNSGEIRSTRLPSTPKFLERPCVFYNLWFNRSSNISMDALQYLMLEVAQDIQTKMSHDFIYIFVSEDHPLASLLREAAQSLVIWKARLWYWDASFHFDPKMGCDLAYDPRDSLH